MSVVTTEHKLVTLYVYAGMAKANFSVDILREMDAYTNDGWMIRSVTACSPAVGSGGATEPKAFFAVALERTTSGGPQQRKAKRKR